MVDRKLQQLIDEPLNIEADVATWNIITIVDDDLVTLKWLYHTLQRYILALTFAVNDLERVEGSAEALAKIAGSLAAKLKEAEAREGELREALQGLREAYGYRCYKRLEINDEWESKIVNAADQALSRPRPSDRMERMESALREIAEKSKEHKPDENTMNSEFGFKNSLRSMVLNEVGAIAREGLERSDQP